MISLINATFGNYSYLNNLLLNLSEQTCQDFELIVCDQNDKHILKSTINAFDAEYGIKHVSVDRKGLSYARNRGLDLAEGKVVAFIDDDCTLPRNLIENISSFFAKNGDIDLLSISVRNRTSNKKLEFTPLDNVTRINKENVFDTITSVGIFHRYSDDVRFDTEFGLGAKYGSCEEMDYVVRLLKEGYQGIYDPKYFVYHPSVTKFSDQDYQNILNRSLGHGAFFKKTSQPLLKTIEIILVRPVGGIILSLLRGNLNLVKKYNTMLRGRISGYKSYRSDS